MIRIIIGVLFLISVYSQVTPPVWPEVFHQSYVESYKDSTHRITGKFWFDSKRAMMRVDKQDGQYDAICGSVLPNVTTACTQLIRDGKRYVVYPQRRQCCMCCDKEHGCGVLRRDWLSTAKYEGEQSLQGESFYKWSIPDGSVLDYYYAQKNQNRTPRRLNSANLVFQDYIMQSYSTDPIPETTFALPDYCTSPCPSTTKCGMFRKQGFSRKMQI